MSHSRYDFKSAWSDEDSMWVVTCEQYPSLSCLDIDLRKAFADILRLVADVIDDIRLNP